MKKLLFMLLCMSAWSSAPVYANGNQVELNWGWGGSCDGWYSGDVINTTTGEYDYNYNGYNEKDHEFEHSRKDFFISKH